jgi:hypothetical protein
VHQREVVGGRGLEPFGDRRVVVRPGVDDGVLRMCGDSVTVAVALDEAAADDPHPKQAELTPHPVDGRRDQSQVFSDQRQMPQLGLDRLEESRSRPAVPAPLAGIGLTGGDRPVRNEAAKVIDACHVRQLERSSKPLDPPAVALAPHLAPVVDRLPPELPLGMGNVGRRAGDEVFAEEVGVRADVRALLCDVDRDVADHPYAALGGVAAESTPLALEAHLVCGGRRPRVALPVLDPVRMTAPEPSQLVSRYGRVGLRE